MEITIEGNTELVPILTEIGFLSFEGGLQFDFGNCKLKACKTWTLSGDIICFFGYWRSERGMGEIAFDLPLRVESYEQGLALIAFNLKNADFFKMPGWLKTGLEWQENLPWRKRQKEYEDNPKARIEHEWFRLIVKKLLAISKISIDNDITTFTFDGTILKIESNNLLLVCPGTGQAWLDSAIVKTKSLDFLPKRIQNKDVLIFLWERRLFIANRSFKLEDFKVDFAS
ncbi:MAG: hypothetical protein ABI091_27795 [Ferruginibacter sp.]